MDYDQYVAARRGRLVEEALARGRTPDEADAVVDRLLLRHRREIVRAEDPHPMLVAALADLLDGRVADERRTPALLTWIPLALLALVGVLLATAVLLGTGDDDPDDTDPRPTPSSGPSDGTSGPVGRRVPLLLGYDARQAAATLDGLGLQDVSLAYSSCSPAGLILGSLPPPGTAVDDGDRITLNTSAGPSAADCTPQQSASEAAVWRFVRYVTGRADPPRFAPEVVVVIDGGQPRYLPGAEASTLGFGGLGQYFGGFSGIDSVAADGRYPRLTATSMVPSMGRCGVERPPVFGVRRSLRATLESYDLGDDDTCAIAVDLYTDARGRIDGVSLYRTNPAVPLGQPDVVD